MSDAESLDPQARTNPEPTTGGAHEYEPPDPDAGAAPGDPGLAPAGAGGAKAERASEATQVGSISEAAQAERAPKGARAGPLRRLYDWVLHWATTPYGAPALFGLSFAESSLFPIPPDPLLMALCLGAPRKAYRFALITTVASVAGGLLGYAIGMFGWQALDQFFYAWVPGVTPEAFVAVQGAYDRWGFWAVLTAGLTPIPYKVFTISAGVFALDFPTFVFASVIGRGARFFLLGALIHRYGAPMGRFIDRHFDKLTVVFLVLGVLGFVVLRFLI